MNRLDRNRPIAYSISFAYLYVMRIIAEQRPIRKPLEPLHFTGYKYVKGVETVAIPLYVRYGVYLNWFAADPIGVPRIKEIMGPPVNAWGELLTDETRRFKTDRRFYPATKWAMLAIWLTDNLTVTRGAKPKTILSRDPQGWVYIEEGKG